MDYYNPRLEYAWNIISRHINFKDKTVLDVGCGHGDIIRACHSVGAIVYGLDKELQEDIKQIAIGKENFHLVRDDINEWCETWLSFKRKSSIGVDVLICMSVLPYLDRPFKALEYFKQIAPILILEVQYFGDGPGLLRMCNDSQMEEILLNHWSNVSKIGATLVEGRHKYRSIWLCK